MMWHEDDNRTIITQQFKAADVLPIKWLQQTTTDLAWLHTTDELEAGKCIKSSTQSLNFKNNHLRK